MCTNLRMVFRKQRVDVTCACPRASKARSCRCGNCGIMPAAAVSRCLVMTRTRPAATCAVASARPSSMLRWKGAVACNEPLPSSTDQLQATRSNSRSNLPCRRSLCRHDLLGHAPSVGHDGQRGIGAGGGWERRAVHHVQVLDLMRPAPLVEQLPSPSMLTATFSPRSQFAMTRSSWLACGRRRRPGTRRRSRPGPSGSTR